MADSFSKVTLIDIGQYADVIADLFVRAYEMEAQLLGIRDFPPLFRTADDLIESNNEFYAVLDNDKPVGVIELNIDQGLMDIWSLGVEPELRRRGIAGRLLTYILDHLEYESVVVRTAAVNKPAITLYQQMGFHETGVEDTPEGITLVVLSKTHKEKT